MSTRAIIARATKAGFTGVYHHCDGYPNGLGASLFEAFNGHFARDLDVMLRYLIDEHPAGWSTINGADFTLPPGFIELGKGRDDEAPHSPQCYCHGDRKEGANKLTHRNASGCGCEWAYVLSIKDGQAILEVYSAFHRDGNKAIGMFGQGDPKAQWRRCATIQLTGPEPDWKAVTDAGTTIQRPVVNFV